jgi:spore coat protein U-like protein
VVSGTGSGAQQTLSLYGRVPAQRTPAPGDYKDTVTVTLTF